MLLERRRGINPVLATFLLIAIAVAAAIIVYAFVTGLIGGLYQPFPANTVRENIDGSQTTIVSSMSGGTINTEIIGATCTTSTTFVSNSTTYEVTRTFTNQTLNIVGPAVTEDNSYSQTTTVTGSCG